MLDWDDVALDRIGAEELDEVIVEAWLARAPKRLVEEYLCDPSRPDRGSPMTSKADFNAEEWTTVVEGPLYAGMRVITADRGGTLRESLAMGRVYNEARKAQTESKLLDELVKSPPSIDPERVREAGENIATVAVERVRNAMSIVETKTTGSEADAYKRFVMTVAQAAAGAHKEGGFLGIGGKQVSDAENEALDEVSRALGAPPAG